MTIRHRARCAWGEGPDVLVLVDGDGPWPAHDEAGKPIKVTFGLSVKEAGRLAAELVEATVEAARLEGGWEQAGRPPRYDKVFHEGLAAMNAAAREGDGER